MRYKDLKEITKTIAANGDYNLLYNELKLGDKDIESLKNKVEKLGNSLINEYFNKNDQYLTLYVSMFLNILPDSEKYFYFPLVESYIINQLIKQNKVEQNKVLYI